MRIIAPFLTAALLVAGLCRSGDAQDLRITIPKRTNATPVQKINRGNIQAMTLLQQGRNQEAEDVLRETLKLDPRNPFTLNNLAFAMEGQGDLESALRYYNDASLTHSQEPVVVAIDPHWRGKPISDVAFGNSQSVRARLASEASAQDRAARFNVQGVSALNHNQPDRALTYFEQAFKLDPQNAFSLNNMGFV